MANELIDNFKKMHPVYKSTDDNKIYNYLKDLNNFRTAFPDYKNTTDDKINAYIEKNNPSVTSRLKFTLGPRPIPQPEIAPPAPFRPPQLRISREIPTIPSQPPTPPAPPITPPSPVSPAPVAPPAGAGLKPPPTLGEEIAKAWAETTWSGVPREELTQRLKGKTWGEQSREMEKMRILEKRGQRIGDIWSKELSPSAQIGKYYRKQTEHSYEFAQEMHKRLLEDFKKATTDEEKERIKEAIIGNERMLESAKKRLEGDRPEKEGMIIGIPLSIAFWGKLAKAKVRLKKPMTKENIDEAINRIKVDPKYAKKVFKRIRMNMKPEQADRVLKFIRDRVGEERGIIPVGRPAPPPTAPLAKVGKVEAISQIEPTAPAVQPPVRVMTPEGKIITKTLEKVPEKFVYNYIGKKIDTGRIGSYIVKRGRPPAFFDKIDKIKGLTDRGKLLRGLGYQLIKLVAPEKAKTMKVYDTHIPFKNMKIFAQDEKGLIFRGFAEAAKKEKAPVSVIAIDFDNLKGLNEYYNDDHTLSDPHFEAIIKIVADNVQPFGHLARTGSDEFGAVVAGLNEKESQDLLNKIEYEARQYAIDNNLDKIEAGREKGNFVGIGITGKQHTLKENEDPVDLYNKAFKEAGAKKKIKYRLIKEGKNVYGTPTKDVGLQERRRARGIRTERGRLGEKRPGYKPPPSKKVPEQVSPRVEKKEPPAVPAPEAELKPKIIPQAITKVAEKLTDLRRSIGRPFASVGSPEEIKTRTNLTEKIARDAQYRDQAWKASKETRDMWQKNFTKDQAMEFVDMVEHGKVKPSDMKKITPDNKSAVALSRLAKEYKTRLDAAHEIDKDHDDKVAYIENYFPHIWESAEKAKKFFSNYEKKIGRPGFMKRRVIDFIKDGLKFGLKLKSSNPEELVLMREFATSKYKMQKDFLNEMKEEGLLKFQKGIGRPPEGWAELDKQALRVYFKGDEGMVQAGTWIMPQDAANIVNNYLAPSLWTKGGLTGAIFRGFMKAKNTLVPISLALSGFHAVETMLSDIANSLKDSFTQLTRGDWKTAGKTFARAPFDPLLDVLLKGKKNIDIWYKGPRTEEERTTMETIIRGGFRPKMHEIFRPGKWETFQQSLWEGKKIRAATEIFPAIVNTMAKPIMDVVVPRLKMMSYLRTAEDYLKAHPDTPVKEQDKQLQQIARNMDNRFGQMVYDNLFWNRTIRDLGVMSTLSLGWNLGTIRDFGGAGIDTAKLVKALATGKGKKEVTDKMKFTVSYITTIGLVGGLMTYAMTGERPKEMKDYFYPRTGRTNPDGSDERRFIPAMTKEFFSSKEAFRKFGLIAGTVKYASHKLNPLISNLYDMLITNKDWYGVDIRDPNDPFLKQAGQLIFHMAKAGRPFSVSSYQREKEIHGKGSLWSFAGFMLAPSYVTRSKIQKEIYDTAEKRLGNTKSKATMEKIGYRRRLRRLWKDKKFKEARELGRDLIENRILTPQSISMAIRKADIPPDARMFNMLPGDDQKILLQRMSQEETNKYLRYAKRAIRGWYITERKKKK